MRDRLERGRWLEAGAYAGRWPERSAKLLALFAATEDVTRPWSFSEYGCGPHAPFRAAVRAAGHPFTVATWDLRAWDADTRVVDLDDPLLAVERTDVAVLSGVCEYLRDIAATLAALAPFHRAFLLSYAAVPLEALASDARYLQQMCKRAEQRGWRNHLTLPQLTAAVGAAGHFARVATWRGQTLLLVRTTGWGTGEGTGEG